jgi:D-Tyr-tRNAtyr deacylase
MNLPSARTGGGALVVSQFTLYGDTGAAAPSWSRRRFPSRPRGSCRGLDRLRDLGAPVATGNLQPECKSS